MKINSTNFFFCIDLIVEIVILIVTINVRNTIMNIVLMKH